MTPSEQAAEAERFRALLHSNTCRYPDLPPEKCGCIGATPPAEGLDVALAALRYRITHGGLYLSAGNRDALLRDVDAVALAASPTNGNSR